MLENSRDNVEIKKKEINLKINFYIDMYNSFEIERQQSCYNFNIYNV